MESFLIFLRYGLWAEAANTAMIMENDQLTKSTAFSPCHQFLEWEREISWLHTKNWLTSQQEFQWVCRWTLCWYLSCVKSKDMYILFNQRYDFPISCLIRYEGSDDDDIKVIPKNDNVNNSYDFISNSKSDDEERKTYLGKKLKMSSK